MPKMIEIVHPDPVLRAFMLFMQIAQAAYKYSDRCFYYGSDVTTITFIALKGLIDSGGTMTHSQLARWTNTELHNITSLVSRMKKSELVTTEYSKDDRRVIYIHLTDKGREAFDKAVAASHQIMTRIMQGIDGDKAVELEKLLGIMKANLEQA